MHAHVTYMHTLSGGGVCVLFTARQGIVGINMRFNGCGLTIPPPGRLQGGRAGAIGIPYGRTFRPTLSNQCLACMCINMPTACIRWVKVELAIVD